MPTTNTLIVRPQQVTSVRLATHSNLSGTYSNGPSNNGVGATLTIAASSLTLDSVACAVNDRVALFAQTNGYENGIYFVESIGSTVVLKRSTDFQSADQMKPGKYFVVEAGTEYAGAVFGVIEPACTVVGTDTITMINAASAVATATFTNTGLKVLDASGTYALTLKPGSTLSAARTFTFTTGDADRTLDISAANVTVSTFGATLVDDASAGAALTTLGVSAFAQTMLDDADALTVLNTLTAKRATTAAWGGGGTSNAFTATGLVADDIVVATIVAQAGTATIVKAVPGTDTLTVTFSADPGAGTKINWIRLPAES